jgi:hypothetical protein
MSYQPGGGGGTNYRCPCCLHRTIVKLTRRGIGGVTVYRRRMCRREGCGHRFWTREETLQHGPPPLGVGHNPVDIRQVLAAP